MYIHTVSPVSNIPRQSSLTYFSKDLLSPGTLVEVLYGKNKILGIVLSSESLKNVKEIVRTQDFQLRKITTIVEKDKVDPKIIETIQKWSGDYFIQAGKVITDIFPKWFWGEKSIQPHLNPPAHKRESKTQIQTIEANFSDRLFEYKKEIKKQNTTWICVSNIFALKKVHTVFKNDTELSDYDILLFHSTVAEQKQIKQYTSIKPNTKTIILSTPYYFGIFNTIADLIIYENYGDDSYTLGQKNVYDSLSLFNAIKIPAEKIIFGNDLLPLSITTTANTTKLAFTGYTKEDKRHNELFVNEHIETQFLADISENKKILLVTQYKDTNIKIVCNDCKTTVTCPKCKLALHALVKNGSSYFHCRFCKKSYKSNTKCTVCQSWNLVALGINTKTIAEFIEKKYTYVDQKLLTVSSLSDSEKFFPNTFDSVYVISIDGLMHNPHFNTEEKIVRIIIKLQELGTLFIQTSFPYPNILSAVKNVSIGDWKKTTLAQRKEYTYPPFGIVYTVTVVTVRDTKHLEMIKQALGSHGFAYIDSLYRITIFCHTKDMVQVESVLRPYVEMNILVRKEVI